MGHTISQVKPADTHKRDAARPTPNPGAAAARAQAGSPQLTPDLVKFGLRHPDAVAAFKPVFDQTPKERQQMSRHPVEWLAQQDGLLRFAGDHPGELKELSRVKGLGDLHDGVQFAADNPRLMRVVADHPDALRAAAPALEDFIHHPHDAQDNPGHFLGRHKELLDYAAKHPQVLKQLAHATGNGFLRFAADHHALVELADHLPKPVLALGGAAVDAASDVWDGISGVL